MNEGKAIDKTSNDNDDGPDTGWLRAIGSGLVILVVGFFATVYAADALVTNLTGVGRSTRQYVASAVFVVVVLVLARVLRWLQARGLI